MHSSLKKHWCQTQQERHIRPSSVSSLRSLSKSNTLADMHICLKKRWWEAQKERHSKLRLFLGRPASFSASPACSAAYRNSRRSWFHMLAAAAYCFVISSPSSASTTSNSAPACMDELFRLPVMPAVQYTGNRAALDFTCWQLHHTALSSPCPAQLPSLQTQQLHA